MLTQEVSSRVVAMLEEMASLTDFYGRGPLSVNTVGSGGDTPLIIALSRADLQAVCDLLAAGGRPQCDR